MRRVSGKVSQITRITQRPSGRYPRGLGSLRSRGSHRLHGFHRFHRLDSLRSSDSTDTCRMAICVIRETFSSEKLTRTRHGASLQDGIYGVRWEIWEYWELWEDWEGEGRRWGGGQKVRAQERDVEWSWYPDGGRIVKIGRGRWRERGEAPGCQSPSGRVPGAPRGATWPPPMDFHAPLAFWFFWACQKNESNFVKRKEIEGERTNKKTNKIAS